MAEGPLGERGSITFQGVVFVFKNDIRGKLGFPLLPFSRNVILDKIRQYNYFTALANYKNGTKHL